MEEVIRVKLPADNELFGIVEEMLGGGRFRVTCSDGNERICRVCGKFKKREWIRPGDIVIVKPWEVQGDERGDIIFKYRRAQVEWLRNKKYIEW